jgi:hypothetical protein
MRRILISLLTAILCLASALSVSAQSDNVLRNPQVSQAAFAITPPLRDLVKNQPTELQFGYHKASPLRHPKANLGLKSKNIYPNFKDAAAQSENAPATIPVKLLDWLGLGAFSDTACRMLRPTPTCPSATPRSCSGSTFS